MIFGTAYYKLLDSVSRQLLMLNWSLGTAESCTGGLLAALCTDQAGSSTWFSGGVVAYSNAVKENLLHVPAQCINTHGAVSCEVAEHMAEGCAVRLGVECSVSITGIAGPGGGTPQKPVGTVWLAVATRSDSSFLIVPKCFFFSGSRSQVRNAAVWHALVMLHEALASQTPS